MTTNEAFALVRTLERDGRYDAWMAAHVLADAVQRVQALADEFERSGSPVLIHIAAQIRRELDGAS